MGTLNDSQPVRAAFEREPLMIRLDELHSSRPLPNTAAASRKFLNILASIATVGLVEPLAVARVQGELTPFRVLDGRLRIEALRRLGIEEALCLISTDDESYTYNKHINRLTPAQDARMISRAIERGVLRERIAAVLGIDEVTVKRRASLLEGICPEVAGLLADRNCPGTTFATLKQMKPLRQLEAAELMCGQGNFSSAFAKAILAATPDTLLEQSAPVLRQSDSDLSLQLVRLEKELATLQET